MRSVVDVMSVKDVDDDHGVEPVALGVLAGQSMHGGIEEGRDAVASCSANQGAAPQQCFIQEVMRKSLLIEHQVFVEREQVDTQTMLCQHTWELCPMELALLVAVLAVGDVEMLAESGLEQESLQPVAPLARREIMVRVDQERMLVCLLKEAAAGLPAASLARLQDERIIPEEDVKALSCPARR